MALRVRPGEEALDAREVPREIAEGLAWALWHAEEARVDEMVAAAPELPRVRGDEAPGCTVEEAVAAYVAAARTYYARSREWMNHRWALSPWSGGARCRSARSRARSCWSCAMRWSRED